jgi:hypothetical protein
LNVEAEQPAASRAACGLLNQGAFVSPMMFIKAISEFSKAIPAVLIAASLAIFAPKRSVYLAATPRKFSV